jgi:uncharacterized protein YggE
MKKITAILLLFTSISAFAQGQAQSKPTINVTGSAKVSVKPDLGILNISVSEIKPAMSEAIKSLGEKSNHYTGLLKKLGFSEKDIKTTRFTVSKNIIYRDNKSIDSGFVASQNIRIEFAYSQQILQKIVSEFSKSEKPVDFSFEFELSEALKQKAQAQVIEMAVKDANDKAEVIAKASKIKLASIKTISYGSWSRDAGMQNMERMQNFGAANQAGDMQSFTFTPDDIVLRDTLNIEWFIQ